VIVVADTSPVHYLILIEQVSILPTLYPRVMIPPAVLTELQHASAPNLVRRWAQDPPDWLEICRPQLLLPVASKGLDAGEMEAIALAGQMSNCELAIDERRGRRAAMEQGLQVIGTLGLLRAASRDGMLDLGASLLRLAATNFRVADEIVARLLEEERRRSGRNL
jgi:predicted nucleic acid-binding protein